MPNFASQQQMRPRFGLSRHPRVRRGPYRTMIEAFALFSCAIVIALELIS